MHTERADTNVRCESMRPKTRCSRLLLSTRHVFDDEIDNSEYAVIGDNDVDGADVGDENDDDAACSARSLSRW